MKLLRRVVAQVFSGDKVSPRRLSLFHASINLIALYPGIVRYLGSLLLAVIVAA